MKEENTFGDILFPDFVPETTRNAIRQFWGCFGRTWKDWIENATLQERSECHHGPGHNGFGNPPLYKMADYVLRDYKLSKQVGEDRYKIVRGRYIHHWNNIGSIVDEHGEPHHVSSCDRWIRVLE